MSQETVNLNSVEAGTKIGKGHSRRLSIDPQILGLLIALVALIGIIGFKVPDAFFTPVNFINIGVGSTLVGLTALAAMLVMAMGGLDISIGSLVGMCSAAAGVAMLNLPNTPVGALVGILAAVVAGLLGGLLNGFIVTRGKIDPIIVTLGTYSAYRGLALLITGDGYAVNVRNDAFNFLGSTGIANIPVSIFILLAVVLIFHFVVEHTVPGRNILAIGGNPIASRLAGIHIDRYKLGVYAVSGLIAAVGAIVYTARTQSGQPVSGSDDLALQAITAAILGGVALKGGKGTVLGVVLGVLIIGTLNNGMILLSIPTFYQRVARGLLLIIAVLIQLWQMRPATGWVIHLLELSKVRKNG
jgi:ribose/xylose/arabinose/galactoside ABC-type transport system permease subunit